MRAQLLALPLGLLGCSLLIFPGECGDGVTNQNEECDDGDKIDTNECNNACTLTRCGDGVVTASDIESVEVVYLASECDFFKTHTFRFNGIEFSSPEQNNEFCNCFPGEQSFLVNDPQILASLESPLSRIEVDVDTADLAWAIALIHSSSGDLVVPIADANGGGDALARNPDLCSADFVRGPVRFISLPFSVSEACDDGNTLSGDGCRSDCFGAEACGDGFVDTNEECDDGNNISGDGCEPDCTFICGNDVASEAAFQLNNGCYLPFSDFRSWPEAELDCVQKGGHLVSVANFQENDLVLGANSAFSSFWIGLNDRETEANANPANFVWSDGTPNDFQDFVNNEPNDGNNNEDCVENFGQWNDLNCENQLPYVCELLIP